MPSSSATRAVIHVATLYLPTTASGAQVIRISAHTGPIEANPLPHVPFMRNDNDRLHVFTMQYAQTNGYSRAFLNMFVHQRVFAEYCTQRSGGKPLRIPWEEWGPMNTKLIYPARIQQHWLRLVFYFYRRLQRLMPFVICRYVHGQRVLWPSTPGHFGTRDETAPSIVEVLDFSLAAVLSAQEISPTSAFFEKHKSGTLITSSTIRTEQLSVFKDDVETHLPYVSTQWNLKQAYSGCMIHEDGIIGVNVRSPLSFSVSVCRSVT